MWKESNKTKEMSMVNETEKNGAKARLADERHEDMRETETCETRKKRKKERKKDEE